MRLNNLNHFAWITLYIKRSSYGVSRLTLPDLVVLICRDIKRCFRQKSYGIEQDIPCFYLFHPTMTLKHPTVSQFRASFQPVPCIALSNSKARTRWRSCKRHEFLMFWKNMQCDEKWNHLKASSLHFITYDKVY